MPVAVPVFVPLFMVPVVPVVPEFIVPVEPDPVVVPVEPDPVVEFVVCAFALRAMPATSIQPIIITFFIVGYLFINYLTCLYKTALL